MTAALRLRVLPRYPAIINGTDGVKVTRVPGSADVTVGLDFESLGDVEGIPDPTTNYFAMYDEETGAYYRVPFQSMFDAAGMADGYATRVAAELAVIPIPTRAVLLYGDAAVGDGDGGLYIDTDNGSPDTFVSAGGTSRTWYRAADVNTSRLVDAAVTEPKLDSRRNLKLPTFVPDRTALKALDTTRDALAYLLEAGREGEFKWTAGDFTTRHAGDTQEGVWIKANAVASSEGSWERVDKRRLDFRWFGGDADPAADNKAIVQAAFNVSSGYVYSGFRAPLDVQETYMATGGMFTRSNLHVVGRNGGGFKAKAGGYSGTGAFITNVSTVPAERAVDNVWFDGVVIDLSLITYVGNTTNSENCLGFARGATNVKVTNCLLKGAAANFNIAMGGVGGKGLNFDGGVRGAIVYGNRFEGCYQGWSLRGNEGEFSAGDGKEQVSKIVGFGNHFEDCQVALCLNGRDANEDPDLDAADMMIEIYASTYHNCGFCPDFKASNSNRYKAGVIMAGEAQNVLIDGFRGYNDPDYITQKGGWPASGTVIGQGLSGPIGAVVYGWGANCQFKNIAHNGDVDYHVILGRAVAIGDDAVSAGNPTNQQIVCNKFDVDLVHVGSALAIMRQDDYNAVSSSAQITGNWKIRPDVLTVDMIGANASNLTLLTIEVYSDAEAKSAKGSPSWLATTFGTTLSQQTQKTGFQSARIDSLSIAGGTAINKALSANLGHDFGTVPAHTEVSTTVSLPGVTTGLKRFVLVAFTGARVAGLSFSGLVTAADTVTFYCTNTTATNIASGVRNYSVLVLEL